MRKRKHISKQLKEVIYQRQHNRCVCCLNSEKLEIHHLNPVALGGCSNISFNLILLCPECHKRLHLADLEICLTILEYAYYLIHQELPTDIEQLRELAEQIKEDYLEGE